MTSLPSFTYHPDPIGTCAIDRSDDSCECCGEARGYIYHGPFYAVGEVEAICPWCIASGAAADKFDGIFIDDANFDESEVGGEIIDQVCKSTPSYSGSWQQEQWLSHCTDACEYHGLASRDDVINATEKTKQDWQREYSMSVEDWTRLAAKYPNPGTNLFKFQCRHCGLLRLAWDES